MATVLAWSASATAVWGATINVPGDFPSIQAAHDAASSGDTILVAPGTYVGQITITKAITLASYFFQTGDESFIGTTLLDGGGAAFVIEIPGNAEAWSTIQGFTIQNADDGITPHAKFNLLNCLVRDTRDGVDYEDGGGGLVRFSTFEFNKDDGIDLDGAVDIIIADNIIRDNRDDGIEIRMHPFSGSPLYIIITRNKLYRNGADGIQLIHYDVLTNRVFEISYNSIFNNANVGIGMMDGRLTNEDFRAASIPERIDIFNNTFANNSHGITGGDNTVVLNNIFVGHPVIAVKNVDSNSELAFNLFFGNGADNSGSNLDTSSSVFADPFLTANLALPSGSPAIDAGTAFYIWQGRPVLDLPPGAFSGAAPDIGGFEFVSGGSAPPNPPVLVDPSDGVLDVSLTPTLEWIGDGDNFMVQIATDVAFANIVDAALVSATQYTVAVGSLDHLMTYFWRVDASNVNGTSDLSITWRFTTEAASVPPDPPTLLLPAHGALAVPLEATLKWTGTADDFDIEVATDPEFLFVVLSTHTVSTLTTMPLGALLHDADYYWHVRGNNAFGTGDFSAAFAFTTVAPLDIIPPSQPQNLGSPSKTETTVDLVWDSSTDNVGVSFYNVYRDGVLAASESSTHHTAVGLVPGMSSDFQISAVDAAGQESLLSDTLTVMTAEPPGSGPVTISRQVSASADDAEERLSSGFITLTSSDLELGQEPSRDRDQAVGIRFQDIGVPRGATIQEAYIQFTTDEASSEATSLEIRGQTSGDAPAFTTDRYNVTNRPTTGQVTLWSPPAWNERGASGPDQRTPDVVPIVQEIIDNSDWVEGNAMVFVITGSGVRTGEAFDGEATSAPIITIVYR